MMFKTYKNIITALKKISLNEYIPAWFVFGMCAGIVLIFCTNLFILLVCVSIGIILGLRFVIFQHELFYSKILSFGMIFGMILTYLHGMIIHINTPVLTYGNVEVIGYATKKNQNKYSVVIYSIKDAAGLVHMPKDYKIIVQSEQEMHGLISCAGKLSPIYNTEGLFAHKVFFDKVIGFGKADHVQIIETDTNIIKQYIQNSVNNKFNNHEQMIIKPLLFGEYVHNPELAEKCRKLGISHLFAISGLHFTIFGGIFFLIGRWLLGPVLYLIFRSNLIFVGKICSILGILYYLTIATATWSVIRSALSSLLMVGIFLFKRQLDPKKVLILVLFIILLCWPCALLDIGFQLSFIAVITLLYSRSSMVFITTLPYLLYSFGTASLQPFVGNMVCGPFFSTILMPLLGCASLTNFMWPFPFLISQSIRIFGFLIDLCSRVLVLEIAHKIPVEAVIIWSIGLASWILIRSRLTLLVFSLLTIILSLHRPPNQILIAHNCRDLGFYENRILWVTDKDSFAVHMWESWLKPRAVLILDDRFHVNNEYVFKEICIKFIKNRFVDAKYNGKVILTKWDVLSNKKPVQIVVTGKIYKISRNLLFD